MENRPCRMCQALGHDKDGDHLFLLEDGKGWYCNKPYHKPYFEKEEEEEDVQDVLDMLMTPEVKQEVKLEVKLETPVVIATRVDKDLDHDYRGIPPLIFKKYEVYGSYEGKKLKRLSHPIYEIGGTQLCNKYRELPKKFGTYGTSTKGRDVELFGQRATFSSKTLVITEGEMDAMSLDYVLSTTKYAKPVVVSLPFGANLKALNDNAKFISSFKKVVICPDNDKAGHKFAKDCASLYPDALFMDLGNSKDLNEMLELGLTTEITSAYFDAAKYRPPSLTKISSIAPSLAIPVKMGTSTPWVSLDDITYGLSDHSIISIGAGPSIGKSALVRAIQQHLMYVHKEKIGIFSLEEYQEITLRYLVGYIMNKAIHLPGCKYDVVEAERIAMSLEDRAFIYDSSYYNGEWEVIEEAIRYFVSMGVTKIFIDPVSSLVAHIGSSEANTKLGEIMISMQNLIKEKPVTVIMVNHLNSPASGLSHEEGGRVLPSQFTGSKAQWRYSDLMLGLERDTLNKDEVIKHTLRVRNIKCRMNGSFQGRSIDLHFNQATNTLDEPAVKF